MRSTNHAETNTRRYGMSRRSFLGLAVGVTGITLTPAALAFAKTTSNAAAVRSEWQLVRDVFSFSEGSVPMNAANLCPYSRRASVRNFRHAVQ
jgi:hypothetical protein